MEQPKKELIKEIADLFEDYEEAYVPGEWEAFSASRQKKYPFYYSWISIAAVFLVMASLVPLYLKYGTQEKKIESVKVTEKHTIEKPVAGEESDHKVKEKQSAVVSGMESTGEDPVYASIGAKKSTNAGVRAEVFSGAKAAADNKTNAEGNKLPGDLAMGNVPPEHKSTAAGNEPKSAALQSDILTAQANLKSQANATDSVVLTEKLSTIDFLLSESKATVQTKKGKKTEGSSKWDFGLQVMPAVMRENVNVGAGLTTAYRLSDKFSLSSGVSFIQLEGGKNVTPQASALPSVSSFALSNKELLTVDANLKAIDIPLGLIYKITQNFYTSVGVSYLNVISEKRNNTYAQTSAVSQMATNPQTGDVTVFRTLINEEVAEPSAEMPLKGNSYLGYFNFSFGRKQNLFKGYQIMIEPFIKVPVGKLSNEDLKLTNSGVKFQLSF